MSSNSKPASTTTTAAAQGGEAASARPQMVLRLSPFNEKQSGNESLTKPSKDSIQPVNKGEGSDGAAEKENKHEGTHDSFKEIPAADKPEQAEKKQDAAPEVTWWDNPFDPL